MSMKRSIVVEQTKHDSRKYRVVKTVNTLVVSVGQMVTYEQLGKMTDNEISYTVVAEKR